MFGTGRWHHADGRSYEGEWLCNQVHGKGRLCDNGTVYQGDFVNGKRHGRGLVTFASHGACNDCDGGHLHSAGDGMDCFFISDKRHGACSYTFFIGETFRCTWVDSRCAAFWARQRLVLAHPDEASIEARAAGHESAAAFEAYNIQAAESKVLALFSRMP